MTAFAGADVTLHIGDGASPVETFTLIGGLRVTRMRLRQPTIDASCLGHTAWQALQGAGARSLQVEGEGVFTDSAAEITLQTAAFSGQARQMELFFGNEDRIKGSFMITEYQRGGEIGDIEFFSLELESAGTVTLI